MIQLALDTSASLPTVAILRSDTVLAEWLGTKEVHHSSSLLVGIDFCLNTAQIDKKKIQFISVGIGPGMFTGLRVGVATAKFLADALSIRVAPISSLLALALGANLTKNLNPEANIWAMNDARSQRVYAYSTLVKNLSPIMKPNENEEIALTPEEAGKKIVAGDYLIGEGAKIFSNYWPQGSILASDDEHIIKAKNIGILGHEIQKQNKLISPLNLEPRYLKTGQAHLP